MQLIRYTYPRDVAEFGDQPVLVEDLEARTLVDQLQRAVRVGPEELHELKKPELVDLADQVGAEVPKRGPKGQFVKAITEAQEQETGSA
jgi:hypothetical protein